MKKNLKIAITGGHFTAAIAVIESLKHSGVSRYIWLGHKYTMLHDKEESAEYKEVIAQDIPFYDIKAGKLYRHLSLLAFVSLARIPIGFVDAYKALKQEKPDIVVSFGGYIALPSVIAAYLLKIPIITHEQTIAAGLANAIIAKFANKILLTWEASAKQFPADKIQITGNPVRSEIFIHDKPFIEFHNTQPTLLILGGNQGSHTINMKMKETLHDLKEYNIIHQTGGNTIYNDYEALKPLEALYPTYRVFKGIWGDDIGRAMHQADIIISRSGANTVYELGLLQKKAIFIPLAYAQKQEQLKNALVLKNLGYADIIEEKNLTPKTLINEISLMSKKNIAKVQTLFISDAAERITSIILDSLAG